MVSNKFQKSMLRLIFYKVSIYIVSSKLTEQLCMLQNTFLSEKVRLPEVT